MPIDAARFKKTLGHLPAGITVLTLVDEGGTAWGMTASSVTSLSLDPPMVLACVGDDAAIRHAIVKATFFGVNVLAGHQAEVAKRFADRARHRFLPGETWEVGPAEVPLVPGALARMECRRADVFQGGDHAIVCGVVEWSETAEGVPLLYWKGNWGPMRP
jgi:flavin reductase (DIM6/NTAB) family NADH-FMN oxidoreductase RutF